MVSCIITMHNISLMSSPIYKHFMHLWKISYLTIMKWIFEIIFQTTTIKKKLSMEKKINKNILKLIFNSFSVYHMG